MATTWKKLATYSDADQTKIEGSITGMAYGGIDGEVGIGDGGTGADLTGGTMGQILMMGNTGAEWAPSPGATAGLIIVSDGSGGWHWKSMADSHNHDDVYLNLVSETQQTMTGSFHVDGALEVTGSVAFAEVGEITAATANNGVLGNGASNDGTDCGWIIDIDDDGNGSPEAGDPSVLWSASLHGGGAGWTVGKYQQTMRTVQTYYNGTLDPSSLPSSVEHAGVWAQDASGNVYMSVKA